MTRRHRCAGCGFVVPLDEDELPYRCVCGAPAITRADWGLSPSRERHAPPQVTPADGPGSEFKRLLKSLGVKYTCGWCVATMAEMNRLGADGCRRERGRLVAEIRARGEQASVLVKVVAAVRLAATRPGLALRIDPTDPYPGLFDEAVGRWEERCR
jgi:hypothetical protein